MRLLSRPDADDAAPPDPAVIDLGGPAAAPVPPAAAPPEVAAPAVAPPADDPDDDLWPTGGPPKGVRLRLPSLALLALAVGAIGFVGGAAAYKAEGPTRTVAATTRTGAFGGGAPFAGGQLPGAGGTGTGGGTGRNGGGGTGANSTTGTVASVDGTTIYVTEANGDLKKVVVADGATVTATRAGTAADIRPGDTVVVQGSTAGDGSTQASSVAVNPTRGGFGGGSGGAPGGGTSAPNGATP